MGNNTALEEEGGSIFPSPLAFLFTHQRCEARGLGSHSEKLKHDRKSIGSALFWVAGAYAGMITATAGTIGCRAAAAPPGPGPAGAAPHTEPVTESAGYPAGTHGHRVLGPGNLLSGGCHRVTRARALRAGVLSRSLGPGPRGPARRPGPGLGPVRYAVTGRSRLGD